jgi:predicted ribosomally synthesized peptide with nif11-like leader
MTIRALADFLERANGDQALQAELSSAVEGKEESGCDELVRLAAGHGYHFTGEELHDALEKLRRQSTEGELSDDDLEAVAGGRTDFFRSFNTRVPWMSSPLFVLKYSVSPTRRF